jgi:hypothetical protein
LVNSQRHPARAHYARDGSSLDFERQKDKAPALLHRSDKYVEINGFKNLRLQD